MNKRTAFAKRYIPEQDPLVQECNDYAHIYDTYKKQLLLKFIDEVGQRYEHTKMQNSMLSFNDLLVRLHSALYDEEIGPRVADAVRQRYKAALIDEFQDTGDDQWRLQLCD